MNGFRVSLIGVVGFSMACGGAEPVPDETTETSVSSEPVTPGQAIYFEYNKDGSEVWISLWDKRGEIVVYDDATLTEKTRITGDWLVTPTGKFNVFNTAHDIY